MGAYGWLLWVTMMRGGVRLVAVGDDDAWGVRLVAVGDDDAWRRRLVAVGDNDARKRTVGCCG